MMLQPAQWRERQQAHEAAIDERVSARQHRRSRGLTHPVWDFLFDYYPVRVSHLRRWHPGLGITLADPGQTSPHRGWAGYRSDGGAVYCDSTSYVAKHHTMLAGIDSLLAAARNQPARFDCFGLHEWAMVYRTDQPRHDLPLRLGHAGTDAVVDAHRLRCTHFDAYRFFTPAARPLNLTVLTRGTQTEHEQCGCLHATMDLYKWCLKMGPLVPGELLLAAFDLAVECRRLDMEASPYDCRSYGLGVVAIETAEGKAEYVRRQRELARQGEAIRDRLRRILAAATIE
ncbi:hypothetical protein [Corynebacterium uterequi]|uniref:3-methyladenine DNA glycosylase n=1 Tax=Corynebacterium uterequi TaxID=1072256 RepID=A0A0G3HGI9_9CORY|nr:hypothetical protein [Corynebacterium uterequi]AKK11058.1 hypothetical protein CUTER_05305 [Corynebacterium uterequi]